jgi:hypothetical protein
MKLHNIIISTKSNNIHMNMNHHDLQGLQQFSEMVDRQHMRLQDPGDGSGFSWVIEDRLRYKNMHREKDLALLHEKWAIHVEEEIAAITPRLTSCNYKDTDAKTKKKYEQVVKVNRVAWEHELDAMAHHFSNTNREEGSKLAIEASIVLLNILFVFGYRRRLIICG